jgi:short-subunit dehydrogenase
VNLLGLAETIERVLPKLLGQGHGTMVGLSSLADALPGRAAPSYAASKVGMSYYLEGLASALHRRGIAIVNVRLGLTPAQYAALALMLVGISVAVRTIRGPQATLLLPPAPATQRRIRDIPG